MARAGSVWEAFAQVLVTGSRVKHITIVLKDSYNGMRPAFYLPTSADRTSWRS